MPYVKVNFVDGVTPLNAETLDVLDQGIADLDAAGGGTADLVYNGEFPAGGPAYSDGDIVIYEGQAYICVRPTSSPPTPWTAAGARAYTRVSRRSDFTLPVATTPIQWDAQDYDPTDMFNIANPTRITFPVTGWYRIAVEVVMSAGAASPTIDIRHNASTTLASRQFTGTWAWLAIDYEDAFGAGGYIEIRVTVAAGRTMSAGWLAVERMA